MVGICRLLFAGAWIAGLGWGAEKRLELAKLPPAVQKTIHEQTKGDEIRSITQETEKGRIQYEVETVRNGKHRDFEVDTNGGILEIEEESAFDSLPEAAKQAIAKKVANGKVGKVETVTAGGATLYEAAYTARNGKKHEIRVKPDGTEIKD
jgi:uncharacterized membrane protein YkoI